MISVVMSVYNETVKELNDSINSVLNQSFKDFELIIVSDCPNNLKINSFLKELSKKNDKVFVIFNDKNLGQNISRNRAVEKSNNEYIAVLDADDVMDKDRLKKQLQFMKKNDLELSFSNVSLTDGYGNVTREKIYKLKTIIDQDKMNTLLKSHSVVLGPTIMFCRTPFLQMGGYRDINVEDYDLVSRFMICNKKIGFISEPLVNKKLRTNSISFGSLYEQYVIMKSISKYLRKFEPIKEVPISYIEENIKKIKKNDLNSYGRYSKIRYAFNEDRSFLNLVKLFFSIVISKTVLTHTFWTIKNKIVEKYIGN